MSVNYRRSTTLSCCALLVLGTVTACSSSNSGANSSSGAAPSGTSAAVATGNGGQASAAHATVNIWSWTPIEPTMKKIVQAIEQKHPNITVKTEISPHSDYNTSLKAAAASGSLPEIIGLPPGAQTQQYRKDLQNIGPIATKLWGAGWKSKFPKSAINQATLGNPPGNENLYLIPQETQVLTMWYNKSDFKSAGAIVPKTFNELVTDVRKLKKAGFIPFYQGAAASNFNNWLFDEIAAQTDMSGLQQAQAGSKTWTQPGMVKAASVWKKMADDGVFQEGAASAQQYPTGANLFAAGRVAMISLGSWWLQEAALPTSPKDLQNMSAYGVFPFPAVTPGGRPTPTLGGVDFGWGVTKSAARSPVEQKATDTVIKALVSGVGEQIMVNDLNDLPAFKGFKPTKQYSPDVMKLFNLFESQVDSAKNHLIGNPTVDNQLTSSLQALMLGKTTPRGAMEQVQKSVP